MPLNDRAQPAPTLLDDILDLSRQKNLSPLSPFFARLLDRGIERGDYVDAYRIEMIADQITNRLTDYRLQTGVDTVVLGMSGGVDSAVVAALFKAARYRVIGITMPIHQITSETDRGVEACLALGLEHLHADLTAAYDAKLALYSTISSEVAVRDESEIAVNIRKGNLRARTRMEFAYDIAHRVGGFVASTDNFSELVAGFWTLHGDVGDVAPVQSLLKSWEIPALARYLGVPEATWRATPTDGLGITPGDEVQLGCSYLEWDLMTLSIRDAVKAGAETDADVLAHIREADEDVVMNQRDLTVFSAVLGRCGRTWHKRANPINFEHPFMSRLAVIDEIDRALFRPDAAM